VRVALTRGLIRKQVAADFGISQCQREDTVLLTHIQEQYRLSLNSHGRPRMAEQLK